MRGFLIHNAASGRAPDTDHLLAALARRGMTLVADERTAERVVVAGGDGTIAPAAETAARLGVPLAVVAAGTANDFARAHGLPLDREEAIALAATGTARQPLELARMGSRPFVNVASAGLAPAAARRAEPLKRLLGPLAYSAGAALAGALERPLAARVLADGDEAFAGEAWQVTVASSGAFGGGSGIADADPVDGALDLVVVPGFARRSLPRVALAMRRGTLARAGGVLHLRAEVIEVRLPGAASFNVDGEVVGGGGTARFAAHAAAFDLVVPG